VALRIAEEASLTDVGRQRHTNEDSFYDKPPLFAVADGMGGAQAGEVASAMAIDEFVEARDPDASPEEQLASIARVANRKIWEMAQSDSRRAGMGTTLTAAMVTDAEVAVGHVGDSRLYRMRDGTLEQLTRDHSLVEEFVRQGRLTREQAEKHPQRSVITRALGPESDVDVDTFTENARGGDLYLLCSDGLSGMVPDALLEKILADDRPLSEKVQALIDAANDNGGRDNITAVLFRLEDDEDPGLGAGNSELGDADTIAGTERAPTTEEIAEARTRLREAPEADTTAVAKAAPAGATASRASPPNSQLPTPNLETRPRREPPRRGRWLPKVVLTTVVVLALFGGAVYAATRAFWFLGTNDAGAVTLYRGLPYDLPLGVRLYQQRYVSGVPALALDPQRRKRVLDHQLRSRSDAVDLMRDLDGAATP
jgi:serine/threonine protein phosphatase PrpC